MCRPAWTGGPSCGRSRPPDPVSQRPASPSDADHRVAPAGGIGHQTRRGCRPDRGYTRSCHASALVAATSLVERTERNRGACGPDEFDCFVDRALEDEREVAAPRLRRWAAGREPRILPELRAVKVELRVRADGDRKDCESCRCGIRPRGSVRIQGASRTPSARRGRAPGAKNDPNRSRASALSSASYEPRGTGRGERAKPLTNPCRGVCPRAGHAFTSRL